MANVKISELNELTQVDDDDLLVVVDTSANETKKIRAENVGTGGGGDSTPIGTIEAYSGSTAPNGYLMCDGSAVSRNAYADLFAVIGTTYGSGNGSTTFNLPNLKGRTVVMRDSSQTEFDTLGETGGEKTHTLTVDEIPSHRHGFEIPKMLYADVSSGSVLGGDAIVEQTTHYTGYEGGGQAHNILQPYIVLNYIIKAFKTSSTPVTSQVVNAYSESTSNAYSCNYINNSDSYSTSEIKTNKRWIDGKPIYRRIFSGTLASTDVSLGTITNGNVVTKIDGLVYISSQNQYIPISTQGGFTCQVRSNEVFARTSVSFWENMPITLIIEYTKTTD